MSNNKLTSKHAWIAVAMTAANALYVKGQDDDTANFDIEGIDDEENDDEELKDEEEETWSDVANDDASFEAGPEENEAPAPEIIIGAVDKDPEPPVDYPPEVLDVADSDEQVNDFDDDEVQLDDEAQSDDEAQRQQDDEQLSQELASEEIEDNVTEDPESITTEDPEDIKNEQLNQQIAEEDFSDGLVKLDDDEGLAEQQQEDSNDLDQKLPEESFEEQVDVPGGEQEGETESQKDWKTNDDPVHLQDQIIHENKWEEAQDGADLSDLAEEQPQGDGRISSQYDDKVANDYDQNIGDSLEKALEQDADVPWYDTTNAKNEELDPLRDINLGEDQLTQGQQPGINADAPASATAGQNTRQGQLIMIILLFIVVFMLRKRWIKLISGQKNNSTLPFYRTSYSKKSLD